jgi:hypothetical protein
MTVFVVRCCVIHIYYVLSRREVPWSEGKASFFPRVKTKAQTPAHINSFCALFGHCSVGSTVTHTHPNQRLHVQQRHHVIFIQPQSAAAISSMASSASPSSSPGSMSSMSSSA